MPLKNIQCNKQPNKVDAGQFEKCAACNMASAKLKWCGKWGVKIVAPEKYPPIITQARSFGVAAIKHLTSGMAKRDQREIDRITKICEECNFYVPNFKRCRKCGCKTAKKISWATQNCPENKW